MTSFQAIMEARPPSRRMLRPCRTRVPLRSSWSPRRQHACSWSAVALLVLLAVCLAIPAAQARTVAGGWPWPLPWHSNDTSHGSGAEVNPHWAETLRLVWAKSKDHVGFCVGRSQDKAQRLMVGSLWRAVPQGAAPCSAHRRRLLPPRCRPTASPGRCPWTPPPRSRCAATGPASTCTSAAPTSWRCTTGEGLRHPGPPAARTVCTQAHAPLLRLACRYLLLTDDPEKVPDTPYCSSQGGEQELACAPGMRTAARPARCASVRRDGCLHPCRLL